MEHPAQLVFGPFRLDPKKKQVWRGEELLKLRPMAVSVLQMLVEHSGEVVEKGQLLKKVWAGTYVTKTVLKVCVREIREVLGDDAKSPRYVETVGRQGYRFIGALKANEILFSNASSQEGFTYVVGRAPEIRQLDEWFDKAMRGARQIVFVTGEAGIGKTTLVDLFLGRFQTENRIRIGRGQCLEQYGEGEPYLPIFDALGRLCREPGQESVKALLGQQAPTWLAQMPALLTEAEMTTLQQRVQGATRQRMLREMAEALEALSQESPLVLVLEDLHWSDHSTVELLSYLAQRQSRTRLFVIGTYRPGDLLNAHPLKRIKHELEIRRQCQEVAVGLLSQQEVATYLSKRFPEREVPEALARVIHCRTEGNALFMINVIDALTNQKLLVAKESQWELQGGIENFRIPESLRQVIEQKLEQLSVADQQLLEAASVEGEEFTAAALAAAIGSDVLEVEERCAGLVRQQRFIAGRGTSLWPDGTVSARFGFLHTLYHEVLYARLTPARCSQLHQCIGERLEKGYGERTREIAAELALHFEHGRDAQRTIQYLRQAAENANARFAYHEHVSLLTRGLSLLQQLPDSPERMRQELQWQVSLGVALMATKGYAAPEAKRAYDRARELCQQMGQTPQLIPVLKGLAAFYYVRAELQTAREIGERILRLAQEEGDPSLLLEAHQELGGTLSSLGEFRAALDHLEQGIRLYDPDKHQSHKVIYGQDPGVACLCRTSHALWLLGYPDHALSKSCDALVLAKKNEHPHSLAYALSSSVILRQLRWEVRETYEQAEVVTHVAKDYEFPIWRTVGEILQGWGSAMQGRYSQGLSLIQQGITSWREIGAEISLPYFLSLLAEVYGKNGEPQNGLDVLTEAFSLASRTGECWWEAELYRLRGELLLQVQLQTEGIESRNRKTKTYAHVVEAEALTALQQALDIAQRQNAQSLVLRAAVSLSHFLQRFGKIAEARDVLSRAYGSFTEGFETPGLQRAKALLEELTPPYFGPEVRNWYEITSTTEE
ncbi:MAG: AAA family ATPase [Candidatus Binatia bacterium]